MIELNPKMKSVVLYDLCIENGLKVSSKKSKAVYIAAIEAFNAELSGMREFQSNQRKRHFSAENLNAELEEVEQSIESPKSSLYNVTFKICVILFTTIAWVKSVGFELSKDDHPLLNIAQKVLIAMDCEKMIDVEPIIQWIRSNVGRLLWFSWKHWYRSVSFI